MRFNKDDIPLCDSCGCVGNESCGAGPAAPGRHCELDACGICYCCRELGKDANVARWKYPEIAA